MHLDLTTDDTKYRAYIYSSPTVADLDGDGKNTIFHSDIEHEQLHVEEK